MAERILLKRQREASDEFFLFGFLHSLSKMTRTRTNESPALKTQTDMCPQVHEPHVCHTPTHVHT